VNVKQIRKLIQETVDVELESRGPAIADWLKAVSRSADVEAALAPFDLNAQERTVAPLHAHDRNLVVGTYRGRVEYAYVS
jgi:hypothetical protein